MWAKLTVHFSSIICLVAMVFDTKVSLTEAAWAPLLEDNASIRADIVGLPNPGPLRWADSYSDGDSCYCASTFDHNLALVKVDTPLGSMTVKEVCDLLGEGPTGSSDGRPHYNDIQCGNGPSVVTDEVACPGRTEYGQEGCRYIGPKWNFAPHLPPTKAPVKSPTKKPTRKPTKAPIKTPIIAPSKPPVTAPTKKPSRRPTKTPVKLPIPTPTHSTNNTTACQIVQIDMWNTKTQKIHQANVVNGTKVYHNMEFTFDAVTRGCATGTAIQFLLTGPNNDRYAKTEGQPPYCLYGNSGTTRYGKALPTLGNYTVSVVSKQNGTTKRSISFQIIGGS